MNIRVKRVYNILPWLGESFSNYEAEEEMEYTTENPKLIYAYLNNLIDEQFYHYVLTNLEHLNPERVEEAIAGFKKKTKDRIKYYNKIFRLGE